MPHYVGHILVYVCTYLFKVAKEEKKDASFKSALVLKFIFKNYIIGQVPLAHNISVTNEFTL